MFREIVRKKQALSQEDCRQLLKTEKRGVLSVIGDDGYPYGLPINHYYNEEDGKLYFHSGKTGHKIDALRRNPKASFCVYDSGWHKEGEWALHIRSVIVFGRIEMLQDHEKALDICRRLSCGFTDDTTYIDNEIARFGAGVCVFVLTPEHITGKQVNEA
ncbi:MAG: pyridoxamine 5'-phosphate oxidase family protein [Acutalibacteraceae bacterium]|nr:pyridoxamine 5'-phosphate oxidase family protein [Acutalibacteraceae bacterium]